jgi:hypothetical protein
MTQHLHAKSWPSGKLDGTPFTDTAHVRTLDKDAKFIVSAGKTQTSDDYTGKPAYSNALATPSSVAASPPKPKPGSGASAWARNKATVTADVTPAGASKVFAIRGPKLGSDVDPSTGEVLIGDKTGTLTVRVWAGSGANFDEATITITLPPLQA